MTGLTGVLPETSRPSAAHLGCMDTSTAATLPEIHRGQRVEVTLRRTDVHLDPRIGLVTEIRKHEFYATNVDDPRRGGGKIFGQWVDRTAFSDNPDEPFAARFA